VQNRLATGVVVCALTALAAAVAVGSAPAAGGDQPNITIIGDSVMTGVLWHNDAIAVMQQGLDVDWQVAVCRRLEGESCPFEGAQVPTFVDLVHALGPKIAPTVVVEMGYNDFEQTFAQSVEDAIRELLDAGVKHILWVNLREVRHPYVDMNDVLVASADRYPQLTIVDWNRYARSHPEWFQNDGEHLVDGGGLAMATLVHAAVMKAIAPVAVAAKRLPVAHVGRAYVAKLVATGGTMPYSWRVSTGALPAGLRLTKDGRIVGVPKKPARVALVVQAADAVGGAATARESLTVSR
jgi:hypothetical protein